MSGMLKRKEIYEPMAEQRCVTGNAIWTYIDGKWRGMVAARDLPAGTLVERSPVIVFPPEDLDATHGREPVIGDYVFWWEEKGEKAEMALPLGHISVYNHSFNPNAGYGYNFPEREMEIVALRDIKEGEEITLDYDCELWFDVK